MPLVPIVCLYAFKYGNKILFRIEKRIDGEQSIIPGFSPN